jgi:hypothetical protein
MCVGRLRGEREPTNYCDSVKWKLLVVAGAVAGGLAYLARQRARKARNDAALWAEATDPVAPSAG